MKDLVVSSGAAHLVDKLSNTAENKAIAHDHEGSNKEPVILADREWNEALKDLCDYIASLEYKLNKKKKK